MEEDTNREQNYEVKDTSTEEKGFKGFMLKIGNAILKKPKFSKTQLIAMNGVLCALVLLFVFAPIKIGTLQLAFIPIIAVIIAAEFIGIRNGMLMGLFFGIVSLINQFINPSILAQAFYNPLVSIIPRILIGVSAYYAAKGTRKLLESITSFQEKHNIKRQKAKEIGIDVGAYAVGAIAGVCTNTILVCGMILAFHFGKVFGTLTIGWPWIIATITGNFVIELAICTVVTPPIIIALKKVIK